MILIKLITVREQMDLVQLRMFCSVAETGSVARAAEQLHRVPSNLTTRLRQLEQEIGEDLLIRETTPAIVADGP